MHRDHGGNLGAINFSAVNSIAETSVHLPLLSHGKCAVKCRVGFSMKLKPEGAGQGKHIRANTSAARCLFRN
jgi:hypothetical protein